MAGYIGTQAVSVNTTSATISDDLAVGDDALITGTLTTTAATVFNGGFAANDGSTITVDDNTANLTLTCTDADATVGPMQFFYRQSSSAATNDQIGTIFFTGRNAANNADVTYASIVTNIADVDNGGKLTFNVATHDGESQAGLILSDGNAEDEIDVTIGNGTSSLTSVAGTLGVTGETSAPSFKATDFINIQNDDAELYITNAANNRYARFRRDNTHNDIDLAFFNGSSTTNKFKFRASGDLQIAAGNLVVAQDQGIDFSAETTTSVTGASSTSELLDHYEEGTFTPVNSAWSNVSETIGNYTRIGNIVHWNYYTRTFSPGTGEAGFSGLPFVAFNDTGRYYTFNLQHNTAVDGNSIGGFIIINTTNVRFVDGNSVSGSNFAGGDNKYMMVSGWYAVV